jgi:hypothetical protein
MEKITPWRFQSVLGWVTAVSYSAQDAQSLIIVLYRARPSISFIPCRECAIAVGGDTNKFISSFPQNSIYIRVSTTNTLTLTILNKNILRSSELEVWHTTRDIIRVAMPQISHNLKEEP